MLQHLKPIKRFFDILCSALGLILLSPLLLILSIIIIMDSKGGIFFRQIRVGKNNKDFHIFKFRTMLPDSEKKGALTVGNSDSRITKVGRWLRKSKLDELPQLLNVLLGEMSLVGPRPEVRKYVNLYSEEQKQVLSVKPGLTDPASIAFSNENELLKGTANPEEFYIERVMPKKISINIRYIQERKFGSDLVILWKTLLKLLP